MPSVAPPRSLIVYIDNWFPSAGERARRWLTAISGSRFLDLTELTCHGIAPRRWSDPMTRSAVLLISFLVAVATTLTDYLVGRLADSPSLGIAC